ncbi:MAG: N-succinylarginine dihydrolase [Parachlamydiaceae bacterium]|nr:N-succinylarginine dihydrolase [Parachlamydiaceae bacterium]
MTFEVNFDSIVGPTHSYSGLSYGNIASHENRRSISNPKEAALQGLEKMKFFADLGVLQAVFPPHERPHIPTLRALGFGNTESGIIKSAYEQAPEILNATSSAAYMWAANAATVCPSIDSIDNHLHFTAANLSSKFHRSIEHITTEKILKLIFKDPVYFKHHAALPPGNHFADEGAANHLRFCKNHGSPGVQLFVFGYHAFRSNPLASKLFPARQSSEASSAIARLHRLFPERTLFVQQNPDAIDTGAFHNDVVSVANDNFFLFHEKAFIGKDALIEEIRRNVAINCEIDMIFNEVKENEIPLKEAINSYFFNSQIITLPTGEMCMLAPIECQESEPVKKYIDEMLLAKQNPISQVHFLNLRQSMRNGGGPACLRLKVVMTEKELNAAHPYVFLNDRLYQKLHDWICKHYRDKLEPKDFSDPQLLLESKNALDELTKILHLGAFYNFQIL